MNVLMDLDGTLTDPAEGIVACLKHALQAMDRAAPSYRELTKYIGPPIQDTFKDLLGTSEAAQIARGIRLYRERYSTEGLFQNAPYPEIPQALRALKEAGATLFVATSKPQPFAERILDHFGLAAYFRAIYGSSLDGANANKADLIAALLKSQSLRSKDACMVGDRSHDVVGARANGVRAIGVLWGYGSRTELLTAGAQALCERPAFLPDAVSG